MSAAPLEGSALGAWGAKPVSFQILKVGRVECALNPLSVEVSTVSPV